MSKLNPYHYPGDNIPAPHYAEPERFIRALLRTSMKQRKATKPTVHVIQRHVSASGMTRHLSLVVIVDGAPWDITSTAAQILGWKTTDDGYLKVHGAGMDMHFHTVYRLAHALYPNGNTNPRDEYTSRDAGYMINKETL